MGNYKFKNVTPTHPPPPLNFGTMYFLPLAVIVQASVPPVYKLHTQLYSTPLPADWCHHDSWRLTWTCVLGSGPLFRSTAKPSSFDLVQGTRGCITLATVSCYLNSVMQVIFSLPEFKHAKVSYCLPTLALATKLTLLYTTCTYVAVLMSPVFLNDAGISIMLVPSSRALLLAQLLTSIANCTQDISYQPCLISIYLSTRPLCRSKLAVGLLSDQYSRELPSKEATNNEETK